MGPEKSFGYMRKQYVTTCTYKKSTCNSYLGYYLLQHTEKMPEVTKSSGWPAQRPQLSGSRSSLFRGFKHTHTHAHRETTVLCRALPPPCVDCGGRGWLAGWLTGRVHPAALLHGTFTPNNSLTKTKMLKSGKSALVSRVSSWKAEGPAFTRAPKQKKHRHTLTNEQRKLTGFQRNTHFPNTNVRQYNSRICKLTQKRQRLGELTFQTVPCTKKWWEFKIFQTNHLFNRRVCLRLLEIQRMKMNIMRSNLTHWLINSK